MTTKTFHTLDLVTVYTGIMVSDRGIVALYDVCNHMLGDSVFTHQLPAASRACQPALAEQHPWLADLDPPSVETDADLPVLRDWCRLVVAAHGAEHAVTAIPDPAWKRGNALADLADLMGDRPVIVVTTKEG